MQPSNLFAYLYQRRPRYEGAGMDRAFLAITAVATVAVVLLLAVSLVL
jgi:hypothetical protein